MWIILALLAAFGQALGWALKKKALENKGVNNLLGLVSYTTAGVTLLMIWGVINNFSLPVITGRFVFASFIVSSLNVLAAWAAYRALDKSNLSKMMPFISLTALLIVPIEYLIRDVYPNMYQLFGMSLVVVGAIIFSFKEKIGKEALTSAKYFAVTLICYSITSPYTSVMVNESSSGLFTGVVIHLCIAFGFVFLFLFSNEQEAIQTLKQEGVLIKTIVFMIIAGLVIALLENGPINTALESANASEVFALKRTMPFFALLLGVFMFGEKIKRQHMIGTIFLVAGAILVVWYK